MKMRCLTKGCNPVLDEGSAVKHAEATGHRVAKCPVRSAEGQRKATIRNKTGYYRKYNVGDKSPSERGIRGYEAGYLTSGEDFDSV